MKLKDYETKENRCFSTILFLLFLITHHNRMMLVGVIIPGFLMTPHLPRVQRDPAGPCGFGVEAALLLPAPGDGRAAAVFLDIQRGLTLWLVQTSEPKGHAAGAAKTFGASLQARVSSSKSHALTRCST